MRHAPILLTVLLSVASPATAQQQVETDTGSLIAVPRRARISEDSLVSKQARARVTLSEFARCVVDRKPRQVAAIVALPANRLQSTAFVPVATDDCLLAGEMRMGSNLMRGALFVELYRRRDRAAQRGTAWSLPAVPFDPRAVAGAADGSSGSEMALLSFADCVVRQDPETAKAVVLRPSASKEQDAAIAAITPHIGQCLPAGQKLELGKIILEGALGEVLYRGTVPVAPSVSQEAR